MPLISTPASSPARRRLAVGCANSIPVHGSWGRTEFAPSRSTLGKRSWSSESSLDHDHSPSPDGAARRSRYALGRVRDVGEPPPTCSGGSAVLGDQAAEAFAPIHASGACRSRRHEHDVRPIRCRAGLSLPWGRCRLVIDEDLQAARDLLTRLKAMAATIGVALEAEAEVGVVMLTRPTIRGAHTLLKGPDSGRVEESSGPPGSLQSGRVDLRSPVDMVRSIDAAGSALGYAENPLPCNLGAVGVGDRTDGGGISRKGSGPGSWLQPPSNPLFWLERSRTCAGVHRSRSTARSRSGQRWLS